MTKKSTSHNVDQTLQAVIRKLNGRAQKAENENIIIREIIAHHEIKNHGEFSLENPPNEMRETTLARMIEFVAELAQKAIRIHIEDNFEPLTGEEKQTSTSSKAEVETDHDEAISCYGTMKSTHKNNLTRVTLNEFGFYPHPTSGPLTQDELQYILGKLDELAQKYPDNLHLSLGTLPVLYSENAVRNIGIYIQCGQHGAINVFSKAIPYNTDPIYPNTVNVDFSAENPTAWINDMSLHLNKVTEHFQNKFGVFIQNIQHANTPKYINGLSKLVDATNNYIEHFKKLIKRDTKYKNLELLIAKTTKLQNNFESMKRQGANIVQLYQVNEILFGEIVDEYLVFEKHHLDARDALLRKIPNALLPDLKNQDKGATYYTGSFDCTTAGGAKFHMVAEICFDHALGVYRQKISNDINNSKSKGEYTYPERVSHTIVSNSVSLNMDNVIGHSILHADPKDPTLRQGGALITPQREEVIQKPKFGTKLTLKVYPPNELSTHIEPIKKIIDVYHEFQIELESLQIIRSQQPTKADIINEKIVLLLIDKMMPYFDKVSDRYRARFATINPTFYDLMSLLNRIENELIDDDAISLDAPQVKESLRVIRAAQSIIHLQVKATYEMQQSLKQHSPSPRRYIEQNNARPLYQPDVKVNQQEVGFMPSTKLGEPQAKQSANTNQSAANSSLVCAPRQFPLNEMESLSSIISCTNGIDTLDIFQKGQEGDVSTQSPLLSQQMPLPSQCQPIQFFAEHKLKCETPTMTYLLSSQRVTPKQSIMDDFVNAGAIGLIAVEANLIKKSIQFVGSFFTKSTPLSQNAQQQANLKIASLTERLTLLKNAVVSVGQDFSEELKHYYHNDIEWYQENLQKAQAVVKRDPNVLQTLKKIEKWIDAMEDAFRADLSQAYPVAQI